MCAEILSQVIRGKGDIRGIVVHGEESRVSQYVDDTTLVVDEDLESIISIILVLKWFKEVSALDINKEKREVVMVGALRDSSIPWQGMFGFNWSDTLGTLGIYYDIKKFNEITELDILRKMGEIQKIIRIWSTRNLTPYRKIIIIKSILMSKITHMLLSLPGPNT